MTGFDHIRIEGDGTSPRGHYVKIYRNGDLIPGVTKAKLIVDASGVQKLVLTQIVILEAAVGIEEATQALEEREQIWSRDGHDGPPNRIDYRRNASPKYPLALSTDLAGDETSPRRA